MGSGFMQLECNLLFALHHGPVQRQAARSGLTSEFVQISTFICLLLVHIGHIQTQIYMRLK
jgi:hypothetical protein